MSARLGSLQKITFPSTKLAQAYFVLPPQWIMIVSMYFEVTTSALAGNRVFFVEFWGGNQSYRTVRVSNGVAVPANSSIVVNVQAGLPNAGPIIPGVYNMVFPSGFCVSPNSAFDFFDQNSVDPNNDSVLGNLVYST